jgi:hypothetical protein
MVLTDKRGKASQTYSGVRKNCVEEFHLQRFLQGGYSDDEEVLGLVSADSVETSAAGVVVPFVQRGS